MELHERLNTSKPAHGRERPVRRGQEPRPLHRHRRPRAAALQRQHGPGGPPRAGARGRPRPARPGDGDLARRPAADRARDHRRHPRPRPARAAPRRRERDRDHGQRPARHLDRARRPALPERRRVQRRVAPAPDHQQDGRPGRPPHRRVVADGRRAPARRQPRQRGHPAALAQRSADHDPQVQPQAADARRHDQARHAQPGDGRVPAALHQGPAEHAHLGRNRLGQDDAPQRALDRDPERGADRHDRGRGRAPAQPGARAAARVAAEGPRGRERDPDPRRSCATRCACGPTGSSSARFAAPRRSTCSRR